LCSAAEDNVLQIWTPSRCVPPLPLFARKLVVLTSIVFPSTLANAEPVVEEIELE
jgi:hypothetical protein